MLLSCLNALMDQDLSHTYFISASIAVVAMAIQIRVASLGGDHVGVEKNLPCLLVGFIVLSEACKQQPRVQNTLFSQDHFPLCSLSLTFRQVLPRGWGKRSKPMEQYDYWMKHIYCMEPNYTYMN